MIKVLPQEPGSRLYTIEVTYALKVGQTQLGSKAPQRAPNRLSWVASFHRRPDDERGGVRDAVEGSAEGGVAGRARPAHVRLTTGA
jgi:hypothetical protein